MPKLELKLYFFSLSAQIFIYVKQTYIKLNLNSNQIITNVDALSINFLNSADRTEITETANFILAVHKSAKIKFSFGNK